MAQTKRIEILSKQLALEILKAYHREIKSGFVSDASAVERERGQWEAFKAAKAYVEFISLRVSRHGFQWLEERIDE